MMSKFILIMCLLFFTNSKSQNIEKIKEQNVLFIYFNKSQNNQQKNVKKNDSKSMNRCWYKYTFLEENKYSLQNEVIQIVYNEFVDYDEMHINNPVLLFNVNKSFLRKNKNIIITKQFMDEIGYLKSLDLLRNAKKILLIEENPYNKKEVILKEVILFEIGIE